MQSVPVLLEDFKTETMGGDTASVVRAVGLAEEYLLSGGAGAGAAELEAAVQEVRLATEVLNRLLQGLEALQWDVESEEMDAELRQRGYVQTAPGAWTSPSGEKGLSQFEALSRVDEESAETYRVPAAD